MSNECICKDKLVPPLINRINLGLHAKVFVREIFLSFKKKKKISSAFASDWLQGQLALFHNTSGVCKRQQAEL